MTRPKRRKLRNERRLQLTHRAGALLLLPIILSCLLLAGCYGEEDAAVFDPDIIGRVRGVHAAFAGPSIGSAETGTLFIESDNDGKSKYKQAYVEVTERTRVSREEGGILMRARFSDLLVGQRVKAKFLSPILEESPVRTDAMKLIIMSDVGLDQAP